MSARKESCPCPDDCLVFWEATEFGIGHGLGLGLGLGPAVGIGLGCLTIHKMVAREQDQYRDEAQDAQPG